MIDRCHNENCCDQLDTSTIGAHLDTAYKRDVLSFLSNHFSWDDYTPAGELELVQKNGETVQCALILMSEWRSSANYRATCDRRAISRIEYHEWVIYLIYLA